MAYTNEQIQQYTNNILSNGGSWNDVLAAANNFGVSFDQLAGAGGMSAAEGARYLGNQGVDLSSTYTSNAPSASPPPPNTYGLSPAAPPLAQTVAAPIAPAPAPSYTNDQIHNWVDTQKAAGMDWNTILSTAQGSWGVNQDQLAAAYGMTPQQGSAWLASQNAPAQAPVATPAPAPVDPTAGYRSAWDAGQGQLGETGSVQAGNKWITPIYGAGSYSGMDNYTPGAITGYRVYDSKDAAMNGKASVYNNTPYTQYDANWANPTQANWSGLKDNNEGVGIASVLAAPLISAGMQYALGGVGGVAGGATGGLAPVTDLSTYGALQGAGSGLTTVGMGAGAEGLGAGVVDLGGGLSIGADGSIIGATAGSGGALTNAEIMAMINGEGLGAVGAGTGAITSTLTPPPTITPPPPVVTTPGIGGLTGSQIMTGVGGAGAIAGAANGFTDGGTAGGALDTNYATGSAGTPGTTLSGGVIPNGTGGTVSSTMTGSTGLNVSTGYTDGGTAGGVPGDTYNNGSAGTPGTTVTSGGVLPNGTGGSVGTNGTNGTNGTTGTGTRPTTANGGGTTTGGGSGGQGSNFDLSSLLNLLGGVYGANQQKQASQQMQAWLNQQMASIDNLYAPGSPEYNYLQQQMERKDAASGRNSQYGPRSVDLAARIAEVKTNNKARLTQGIANNMASSINQNASAYSGLAAALGSGAGTSALNSIGSLLSGVTSGLGNLFSGSSSGLSDSEINQLLSHYTEG